MASVSSIKTDITSLGDYESQELFNYIGEMLKILMYLLKHLFI